VRSHHVIWSDGDVDRQHHHQCIMIGGGNNTGGDLVVISAPNGVRQGTVAPVRRVMNCRERKVLKMMLKKST
jgi:hypothetical protein